MATYTNGSHNYAPRFGRGEAAILSCEEADRSYANGDIVEGPEIAKGNKIVEAWVAGDELDSNASPTATATLRITDGTTTQNLATVTAVQIGTSGGFVTRLNVPDGFNYVVSDEGFWLELVFTAAFATAASGRLAFGVLATNNLWGSEQP